MADRRMVAFRSHTRGDLLIRRGQEFTVTEEEAHGYASRANPLAGPLDIDEQVTPIRKSAPTKATPAKTTRKKGK